MLKQHCTTGGQIFRQVKFPWPIKDIIYQHHERIDGSGYPQGLTKDKICIEARIVAVADTFDAMACDRPYRKKLGVEMALKTIIKEQGKTFDTDVVNAFLQSYNNDSSFGGRYEL